MSLAVLWDMLGEWLKEHVIYIFYLSLGLVRTRTNGVDVCCAFWLWWYYHNRLFQVLKNNFELRLVLNFLEKLVEKWINNPVMTQYYFGAKEKCYCEKHDISTYYLDLVIIFSKTLHLGHSHHHSSDPKEHIKW